MASQHRIAKLADRMKKLLQLYYEENEPPFALCQLIDRYYYIQKIAELELLHEALAQGRLGTEIITDHYIKAYCQWRKDVRRLNAQLPRP